mmetsp:Transcript_11263/g.15466  ORF Transcript_11263/g.15466 Transcript_11263/m.15466 type:complete len:718 (-) Transcript_11263:181-2334(-)
MLKSEWWSLSPSSAWIKKKEYTEEGSRKVWKLEKSKDPLLGRELPYWPNYGLPGASNCGNSEEILEEHILVNGSSVRTRFPPEPNGYLHIGHAKSMNMNFSLAFAKLGFVQNPETIFRYDDTNPEKETEEFVQSLRYDVEWMGWSPFQVSHTSDYFDVLYALALKLIDADKAYVCDQSAAEIEACRKVAKARLAIKALSAEKKEISSALRAEAKLDDPDADKSPYRKIRSVAQNRKLFQLMRAGAYDEGSRTLRLKMMNKGDGNLNMMDQVAYRIKFKPHPHVGDTWCIYPTYDYTHCVIDALEHVDYSICTLEFETRRESYYWVLDALDIYRPKVFEMSRLNLTYTVLSKRKLTKLVDSKRVRGWDDPRMPTISGMRRRGFSAKAINAFCTDIGVTRNENHVEYERLEHFVRLDLEATAKRRLAVKQPLRVHLTNFNDKFANTMVKSFNAPEFPGSPNDNHYQVNLTPTVYIDSNDFQAKEVDDFFGLTIGKVVRLRHCVNIRCDSITRTEKNAAPILNCTIVDDVLDPKGKIHWLSEADITACEFRDYDHLFKTTKIDDDDWENQLNPNSEKVFFGFVHKSMLNAKPLESVQFERLGYYVVDSKDSTPEALVFNRTLDLRSTKTVDLTKKKERSRKDEQEALRLKKESLKSISPTDMFKVLDEYKALYSAFDNDGLPTHDANGEPLAKSAIKKLKKDQAKQKKLYDAFLASSSAT